MTLPLSPLLAAVLAAGSGSRYPIPPSALGLVASGTIKRETHDAIKAYLQPYNAALDQMFPSTKFW